jgi:RNA polymerase sigma factor (sigma-70 family)
MQATNKDGLGNFLQRMGKKELLTHEEELALARKVQAMVEIESSRSKLATQFAYIPNDTQLAHHLEINELELKQTIATGLRAKNQFIECNLKLVVSIAKRYSDRGMPLEDLIQEGAIGAGQAALKFDPSKGFKFSTYATWWIRQAITRALGDKANAIRLPLHIFEVMNKVKRATSTLVQQHGRQPTPAEIDSFYGWSKGKTKSICEYHRAATRVDSINRKVGKDADTELGELLANHHNVNDFNSESSPISIALARETQSDVSKLFQHLNENEICVLRLYYGLDGFPETKLAAIAKLMSMSRERVRQIKVKAIYKIKIQARRLELT